MNKTCKIISAAAAFVLAAGLGFMAYTSLDTAEDIPTPLIEAPPPTEAPTEPPTLPVYESFSASPDGMTEMAKLMRHKNKDYAGWLRIANTYVDYPLLKDPGEIPEGQPYYGNEYYDRIIFIFIKILREIMSLQVRCSLIIVIISELSRRSNLKIS